MIQTKESNKTAAEVIRSVGHPARIGILILLNDKPKKKMTVTQIYGELGLTQSETSRHLSILKNNGVLRCEKNGFNSYYFINEEHPFIHCMANCMIKNKANIILRK